MLTQTLRGLEHDGLIQHRIFTVVPPRLEYRLTWMGESVIPLLRRWAKEHAAERDLARRQFDSQRRARETAVPSTMARKHRGVSS